MVSVQETFLPSLRRGFNVDSEASSLAVRDVYVGDLGCLDPVEDGLFRHGKLDGSFVERQPAWRWIGRQACAILVGHAHRPRSSLSDLVGEQDAVLDPGVNRWRAHPEKFCRLLDGMAAAAVQYELATPLGSRKRVASPRRDAP